MTLGAVLVEFSGLVFEDEVAGYRCMRITGPDVLERTFKEEVPIRALEGLGDAIRYLQEEGYRLKQTSLFEDQEAGFLRLGLMVEPSE